MYKVIFKKLFRKKWELLILGVIVIVCALVSKIISIDHWESLDFDVTGYSPLAGPIGIIWMTAFLLVLFLRKIKAPSLWIMGIAGMVYSLVQFWMVNL